MSTVVYTADDGSVTTIDGRPGDSVMETAVRNGVPGIVGECGGSLSCATCHVFVAPETLDAGRRPRRPRRRDARRHRRRPPRELPPVVPDQAAGRLRVPRHDPERAAADAARRTLIVGACQAGVQLAATLRDLGDTDPIVMIGEEAHRPYQRPPLSKGWLKGELEPDDVVLRTRQWFDDRDIDAHRR